MDLLTQFRLRKVAAAISPKLGKALKYGALGASGLGIGAGAHHMLTRPRIKNIPATANTAIKNDINGLDPSVARTIGYTGSGALAGALAGGLLSKENKLRNAILGAAVGGAGGYLADYGCRKYMGE